MNDLIKSFSLREVFSFIIPGFLLLFLFYLIVSLFFWEKAGSFFVDHHLIWLTEGSNLLVGVLVVLMSYFLGLISVHFSYRLLRCFLSNIWDDDLIETANTMKTLIAHYGFVIPNNIKNNKIFYFCKYYVVHHSERLGKILLQLESEIGMLAGAIIPALLLSFLFAIMAVCNRNSFLFIPAVLFFLIAIVCLKKLKGSLRNERESSMRFYSIVAGEHKKT